MKQSLSLNPTEPPTPGTYSLIYHVIGTTVTEQESGASNVAAIALHPGVPVTAHDSSIYDRHVS
jgi:hypothetical protein